ncbi:hypothetical protein GF322_02080 [Candidatus Dependentiae bacterium]|nr:hypothetical protein [Candidatus Dependentiae bacterium]
MKNLKKIQKTVLIILISINLFMPLKVFSIIMHQEYISNLAQNYNLLKPYDSRISDSISSNLIESIIHYAKNDDFHTVQNLNQILFLANQQKIELKDPKSQINELTEILNEQINYRLLNLLTSMINNKEIQKLLDTQDQYKRIYILKKKEIDNLITNKERIANNTYLPRVLISSLRHYIYKEDYQNTLTHLIILASLTSNNSKLDDPYNQIKDVIDCSKRFSNDKCIHWTFIHQYLIQNTLIKDLLKKKSEEEFKKIADLFLSAAEHSNPF